MANITHKIATPARADAFFKAVSTLEGLKSWWTEDVTGDAEAGGIIAFRFGGNGPDMKVETLEDNRVVWRCVAGPEEWLNTSIEYRFEPEAEGLTALYFTHGGWQDETPFHFHCSMKWASFLLSLKQYVELGSGRPFPHDIQIVDAITQRAA